MLRNICNLLPKVFYVVFGALIYWFYLELTADTKLGLGFPEKGSSGPIRCHDLQLEHYQPCKCQEVLKSFELLQKRAFNIENELYLEKKKLKTLLHKLQEGINFNEGELPSEISTNNDLSHNEQLFTTAKHPESSSKRVVDNAKLPIWSFSPKFIFRPSLLIKHPKVAMERSKELGAKAVINRAVSQACSFVKKKLKTQDCELVHGSLTIDLLQGLRLVFILKFQKRTSTLLVRVRSRVKMNQKFAIEEAHIVRNQAEIHIITMISDDIPLLRLKKFLEMLGNLKVTEKKIFVYLSIYASAENLEVFKACILESSKNYNNTFVKISQVTKRFERASARHHGVSLLPARNVLIMFADIDITFDNGFLQRCQSYTEAGKSSYFPMVFSMYNPTFYPKNSSKAFIISRKRGYWRTGGLGNLCVYKSDYLAAGGFDTNINGWGSEDDDLYER